MAGLFLSLVFLLSFSAKGFDGPGRAPGMERPFENASDFKFEFIADQKIFKDEAESREYQNLFEKNKDSSEVKEFFASSEKKKKEKMEEMRKSDVRPDFSKMKEEREAEKISMAKELKTLLEKKKTQTVKLVDAVKCEAGKPSSILEKGTTDSMKDASKVVKIVMTEEELAKMKKEIREQIKDEVKKEVMAEMKSKAPNERPSFDKKEKREEGSEKPERKMAGGGGTNKRGGGMQMGSIGGDAAGSSPYGSINMNNLASYFGGSQNQMSSMQMNQYQNVMPTQMNQYQQQMNRGRPINMGRQMGNRQMPMQLNSNINYNYNNQYNQMYGQTQNYFNPYSSYQYQMRPWGQPSMMMTMGN